MTRNTHDIELDHHGTFVAADFSEQGDDPEPPPDGQRVVYAKSGGIYEQGHDGVVTGLGFTPVVAYAECSSPAATDPTPAVSSKIEFGTFYDVVFADLEGILPDALGLTYADGAFTATEPGVWTLYLGAVITVAPGDTGSLMLAVPTYGFNPTLLLEASGNPAEWQVGRTIAMQPGDSFYIQQVSSGSSIQLVDGYAAMDIIRVAGAVR